MNSRSGIRLLSRPMQSVNCEEIHSGRLQTTATYKASTEQLFMEQIIKNSTTFMTGNIYTSALNICRFYLPFTHCHIHRSAHPLITHSLYNHRTVVTNTGQGHPVRCRHICKQLPDLGRSLRGRQSSQEAPQARNYHWIAAWQVLSTITLTQTLNLTLNTSPIPNHSGNHWTLHDNIDTNCSLCWLPYCHNW